MIESKHNPKVRLIRSLRVRANERREMGPFLAEGIRLVEEANAANWPIRFVLYTESLNERGGLLVDSLLKRGVECVTVSNSAMKSLSETESPQGVLAVLEAIQIPLPKTLDFVLIPDRVRDPGNLGTLLRTAAAASVQAVFIPPETAEAFAPKVVRSGMGAHFRLPIYALTWEEIEQRTRDLQVFEADMAGKSCWETELRLPLALVIGGEEIGRAHV